MAAQNPIPAGMTKADYAEMRFSDALTEADDYDLLVMGRTQGKGCYCFVNGLLTSQVAKYAKNYRYIVVDNEAGLEHLSRGVLPQVDTIPPGAVADQQDSYLRDFDVIVRVRRSLKHPFWLNPHR